MSDASGGDEGCKDARAVCVQINRQTGVREAAEMLYSETVGMPLLVVLTATAKAGSGGMREGGQLDTLPPIKHGVEGGGLQREDVRA
jgi:hypothetical protein